MPSPGARRGGLCWTLAALTFATVACSTDEATTTEPAATGRAPEPATGSIADIDPPAAATRPTSTTTNAVSTTTATSATTNSPTSTSSTMAPSTAPTIDATGSTPATPGRCVESLTLREQIALTVWPAVYPADWATAIEVVGTTGVGGVLLMRPASWTADQLRDALRDLEDVSRHGLIVATDEEGGDVQRLALLGRLPSQREVSTTMTAGEAADLIAAHGAAVRAAGVDMVLGPVVDVEPNVGDVPLQPSRFFSGPPDTVAEFAAAYLEGWQRADLFAVLKHYPGHGAASGDTHITAGVTPSFDDIAEWDLAPYRSLAERYAASNTADADADPADAALSVMIGHLTVPGLTDGVPATRSAAAVDHLRDDLGYGDALLITDALGMAAVGLPEPEASVAAMAAGIDVVLFTQTSQTEAVIDALVDAVERGEVAREHVDSAASKVMSKLGRDGHTCHPQR
ncbi:MAG: glycoside hydrolase family 3 N-terminal domain-containing protein [Ilumatobacter sp.]|uniref:glycoside hydrolase family 3 N-terminal domain-containing protein n=1 Tax=Ilumatobacter sp. TaxID=1967498 RepID=UPI003919C22A